MDLLNSTDHTHALEQRCILLLLPRLFKHALPVRIGRQWLGGRGISRAAAGTGI